MAGFLVVASACGRIGFAPDGLAPDGLAPDCTPTGEELPIAAGEAHALTLCPGTNVFTLDAAAGARITAELELDAAHVTRASLELRSPDDAFMAGPVWGPALIESTALVGIAGEQRVTIEADEPLAATLQVTTTPPPGRVVHIAPDGDDMADGSAEQPWQTWPATIGALAPGDTLIVHDGTWTAAASCAGMSTPCLAAATLPLANCSSSAPSGSAGAPITVLAAHQRRAHLAGAGSAASLRIIGCAWWTIDGIYASSADSAVTGTSATMIFTDTPNLVVRNSLIAGTNRCDNVQAYTFTGAASTDVLVEDNEAYAFHRHAFSVYNATNVTLRRNYAHSRDTTTPACNADDNTPERGDSGAHCRGDGIATSCAFENLFVENVASGILDSDSTMSRVEGTVVHDAYDGMGVWTAQMNPSVRPLGPVEVTDLVCLDCDVGLRNRGLQLAARNVTAVGGRARSSPGLGIGAFSDDAGGTVAETTITDMLAVDNARSGFLLTNQASALVRYAVVSGSPVAFENAEPIDDDAGMIQRSEVVVPTRVGNVDGSCLVYIPSDSNMAARGDAGAPIGANVIQRIVDGVRTNRKLWNQRTGQFPCGALVPGVNDVAGASCFDAHTRVRVGVAGCAIP